VTVVGAPKPNLGRPLKVSVSGIVIHLQRRVMASPPNYSEISEISSLHSSTDSDSDSDSISETEVDIIVGIDFGTTYTGIAYIFKRGLPSQLSTEELAKRINVVEHWPPGINENKVRTILSYDESTTDEPQEWGFEVDQGNTDDIQMQYFKLGLQEDADRKYLSAAGNGAAIGGFLAQSTWKHDGLPNKTPLDFCADYLSLVHKDFIERFIPSAHGPTWLARQKLSYVLTVPAIWTGKAKDLTKQAALRAGIPKVTFVTEPEAAALYCAAICRDVDLSVGERFLVCDAGGGTVVPPFITPW
jgi:hypothetical protein